MKERACAFATDVWLVDLDETGAALHDLEHRFSILAPDERDRARALPDDAARLRWVGAHVALRLIVERACGQPLEGRPWRREPQGRPLMPAGFPGAFSLSHAGRFALIGWTHGDRIGVDIETPRTIRMDQRRQLIIAQAAGLLSGQALPDDLDGRLLQAWVRLEALAKADGRGIGTVLTAIGAVGRRPTGETTSTAGAARALADCHGVAICDLDTGPITGATVYAAVAAPIGEMIQPLRLLSRDLDGVA